VTDNGVAAATWAVEIVPGTGMPGVGISAGLHAAKHNAIKISAIDLDINVVTSWAAHRPGKILLHFSAEANVGKG
jgi:hypothetical protein